MSGKTQSGANASNFDMPPRMIDAALLDTSAYESAWLAASTTRWQEQQARHRVCCEYVYPYDRAVYAPTYQ